MASFYCEQLGYFPEGKIRRFFRGGREIAIVLHEGELRGFSNRCTHEDFQLHFGYIEDGCVHCPIHYGVFDVTSGKAVSGPVTDLETFKVRVEGEDVYVEVGEASEGALPEAEDGPPRSV